MYWLFLSLCLGDNPDLIQQGQVPPCKPSYRALAQQDIAKLSTDDRPHIRYLSLHNIDKEAREDYVAVASLVINSVSRSRITHRPTPVDDDCSVLRIDLRNYKIDPVRWGAFAKNHPYGDVMRIDWFIANAMKAPDYYKLLDVKDEKSFLKLVFADTEVAKVASTRAIVVTGSVARSNRMISRIPTVFGCMWRTFDVERGINDKDYLSNLLSDKYDTSEIIASLPNGLYAYFVADDLGNAMDHQDPKIATHNSTVSQSCIACHSDGIVSFRDDVRELLKKELVITGVNRSDFDRIVEMFSTDINETIESDQYKYRTAVSLTTGTNAARVHKLYEKIVDRYNAPVNLITAAKEANLSVEELRKIANASGQAQLIMLQINTIRREVWESLFKSVLSVSQ